MLPVMGAWLIKIMKEGLHIFDSTLKQDANDGCMLSRLKIVLD